MTVLSMISCKTESYNIICNTRLSYYDKCILRTWWLFSGRGINVEVCCIMSVMGVVASVEEEEEVVVVVVGVGVAVPVVAVVVVASF